MGFRAKKRISENAAYRMVLDMAFFGNHYGDIHNALTNVAMVKEHFKHNHLDFKNEVNKCRVFSYNVPIYENLIGATWTTHGVSVSKYDPCAKEQRMVVEGNGTYNESDYWANFEIAKQDFEMAISSGQYERLLSAINAGISAIEAFLNHQYLIRNGENSKETDLKLPIEKKIDLWVPAYTGQKIDKSSAYWQDFKLLKKRRNEHFVHRKTLFSGITFREFEGLLNKFKTGICQLLLTLHKAFQVRCPCSIIRHSYYPTIEHFQDQSA